MLTLLLVPAAMVAQAYTAEFNTTKPVKLAACFCFDENSSVRFIGNSRAEFHDAYAEYASATAISLDTTNFAAHALADEPDEVKFVASSIASVPNAIAFVSNTIEFVTNTIVFVASQIKVFQ